MSKPFIMAFALLPACVSGAQENVDEPGRATITGTVAGESLLTQSAFFNDAEGLASTSATATLLVAENANSCVVLTANPNTPPSPSLSISLTVRGGTALAEGIYEVLPDPSTASAQQLLIASATWSARDRNVTSPAQQGTVVIKAAASNGVQGTLSIGFTDGTLTGTFYAAPCAALPALVERL